MKKVIPGLLLVSALFAAACSMPAGPSGDPGTGDPTTEPPSQTAVITNGFTGTYDLGDYFSFGEVRNTSSAPVYDVELLITYLDASGNILTTDAAAPLLSRVDPGATAPVYNVLYDAPEGIASTNVVVTGSVAVPPIARHPVTIISTASSPGIAGLTVQGTGRNDSGVPLASVLLVASFRDGSGSVVGVAMDYPVIGVLAPGASFVFQIETFDATLADAAVLVQGEGTP